MLCLTRTESKTIKITEEISGTTASINMRKEDQLTGHPLEQRHEWGSSHHREWVSS